jgi:hypothetical protein
MCFHLITVEDTGFYPTGYMGHSPGQTIKQTSVNYLKQMKSVFFSKPKDRKVKQLLSGCWYQWRGEDIKKRV